MMKEILPIMSTGQGLLYLKRKKEGFPMQKQPAIGEFDVIFDKNQAPPPDHYQDEEVEEIMEDSKDTLGGFVGGALGALNGFHASENNLLEQLNEEH